MTESPGALPERVRARVIVIASEALGLLPAEHVPGPLKPAAGFTAQRRARLAGEQVLARVQTDEVFLERFAFQA